MSSNHSSRRDFLKSAAAATASIPVGSQLLTNTAVAQEARSANEKLNLAVIGVAARGGANLNGVSSENIVALCDIDAERLGTAAKRFPNAKTYDDYRRVFDHTNLDGVVVSTPDHMHAIPVVKALQNGLAVYCEKPLTHSLYEARVIGQLTREKKAVTQMGNQIHNHSSNNYRRVVELIQNGAIGPVKRVHIWMAGVGHFQVGKRPASSEIPKGISYDKWIGPAPYRPFDETHFHFNWRYWWDFGGGQLADFWCHHSDLPYWALGLTYPEKVRAVGEQLHDGENDVPIKMKVDYHFPARDGQPPVHLTWQHGGSMPEGAEVYNKGTAVLFEGEDGRILADYTTRQVFMQEGKEARPVENKIPDSIGHHKEFIEAVKTGNQNTTCNFRYGAMLTEGAHLGNISYRLGQIELEWDAAAMRATNAPHADELIRREYRKGWSLGVS